MIKGKLPGKVLTKDDNGTWHETEFSEVADELSLPNVQKSRILSIESTYDRKKRLGSSDKGSKKEKESFEVFASETTCSRPMIDTYKFPSYLFSKSWAKSNGFAGSKKLPDGNISWFRILVKMIKSMDHYYWHEMTFFIHQSDGPGSHVTVLCFEVPDDEVDNKDSSTAEDPTKSNGPTKPADPTAPADSTKPTDPTKPTDLEPETEPHNFLKELKAELDTTKHSIDWRYIQSLLLRQAIFVVDRGVWACSNAVRSLEKSRPKTTPGLDNSFDFPSAHDLLRHALHSTEILQVASQTLTSWLEQYTRSEKLLQRIKHDQQQQELLTKNSQHKVTSYADDTPLLAECYHADLLATLQLLSNLMHRSASNDARLRNEINLAFNVVNQQDTKAMRIISFVTLTFLPATFVSTLFSMSFFDYDGDSARWKNVGKSWVYFVIAVPLTVLTIVAWVWTARIWRYFFGDRNSRNPIA